jgi:hypothetical protein
LYAYTEEAAQVPELTGIFTGTDFVKMACLMLKKTIERSVILIVKILKKQNKLE